MQVRELEQAAAENHTQLFCLGAQSLGGEVVTGEGLVYTYAGEKHGGNIAFPRLDKETAGATLDQVMAYYRTHPLQEAGCWSLDPAYPEELGILLLARGFQPGWQPCWMALDLQSTRRVNPVHPSGEIMVKADNHTVVSEVNDLPYAADNAYMSQALLQAHPGRAQRFIAWVDGSIVGQTCVFYSTGESGVAGIYNVGVVPAMRRKGIGKALMSAACRQAHEKGYRYAILNANHLGRPLYSGLGFRFLNFGLTWWLMGKRFITNPPTPEQVALAEAVGLGDMSKLESMGKHFTPDALNEPLTNGMTLIQLAAFAKKPLAAEWLADHGARYTALDAWNLQWPDRAKNLLVKDREEVNRRYFDWNATLLHIACERNDIALAQLALSQGTDPYIKDSMHDGTAMDWAQYFKRTQIAELIKAFHPH